MAKLRVGVIGVGFGATVQIPCFQEHAEFEVVAVCASREERAEEARKKFKVPKAFTDYRELLAMPGLDVVSVVTPPSLHHEMSVAAFAAGNHVLCEKPFALNTKEARAMANKARETKRVGMVNHEFRYIPGRLYARDLIAEGYLGELRFVNVTHIFGGKADPATRPYGWHHAEELGGGVLGAGGSHFIDAVRHLTGEEFEGVQGHLNVAIKERKDAATGLMRRATADDTFSFSFRLRNGATGGFNGSSAIRFGPGSRIELYGSKGTLVFPATLINQEPVIYGGAEGDEVLHALPIPDKYVTHAPGDDARDAPFMGLLTRFAQAINGGTEAAPSFVDGLRCQEVMDGVRLSHKQRGWVALPSVSEAKARSSA